MQGLSTIPPSSMYRLNTNTVPNPQNTHGPGPIQQRGGSVRIRKYKYKGRSRSRSRSRIQGGSRGRKHRVLNKRNNNRNKTSLRHAIVNYAGRQIGHFQQRQQGRARARTHSRAGAQSRSRSQSGGTMALPTDANLMVSSLGNLVQNGVATLRGLDGQPSPLPFSDATYQRNL